MYCQNRTHNKCPRKLTKANEIFVMMEKILTTKGFWDENLLFMARATFMRNHDDSGAPQWASFNLLSK